MNEHLGQSKSSGNAELPCSDDEDDPDSDLPGPAKKRIYSQPAQDHLKGSIADLDAIIHKLTMVKDQGLATESSYRELKEAKKKGDALSATLKRKQSVANANRKLREKQRAALRAASTSTPGVPFQEVSGRPRHPDNEELLKTIVDLSMHGSSADERRRTEIIRSCRTLDDLHDALLERGYQISRSATYLRLIPRRSNTIEGRLHVATAPVKLAKAQADNHKSHPDTGFCTASIRNVEALSSVLGQQEVAFLSQV